MPLQMRLSQAEQRLYSPDRDLAYCTPHLLKLAMRGLDPDNLEQWTADYLYENNISNEDLVRAVAVLAEYINKAMLDPQYKHPYDALNAVGFFSLPMQVQTIVCAKIGQVVLSAFFTSIREVTRDPADPPMDSKAIAAVAEEVRERLKARGYEAARS